MINLCLHVCVHVCVLNDTFNNLSGYSMARSVC